MHRRFCIPAPTAKSCGSRESSLSDVDPCEVRALNLPPAAGPGSKLNGDCKVVGYAFLPNFLKSGQRFN
jgi:hypothetical protein